MSFHPNTVASLTGFSRQRLRSWAASGLIRPSLNVAAGCGRGRLYASADVLRLRVAKILLEKGVSLQKCRPLLQYLWKHLPPNEQNLAGMWFLTNGDDLFVLTKDSRKVLAALAEGRMVFAFALGKLMEDLQCEVQNACREQTHKVRVKRRAYEVVLHPDTEAGGYCVACPELPGCDSQGESAKEALVMIRDAIEGHLAVAAKRKKKRAAA